MLAGAVGEAEGEGMLVGGACVEVGATVGALSVCVSSIVGAACVAMLETGGVV